MSENYWDKQQVKMFVGDVRKQVGNGWSYLGRPVQEALIAARAFQVCRSQASETVPVEAMDELYDRMMTEAGLS
jgi:hypothetical protein